MGEDTRDWGGMALRLEQFAADLVETHDVGQTLDGALKLATQVAPCDVASVSLRHDRRHDRRPRPPRTRSPSGPTSCSNSSVRGPRVDVVWEDDDVYVVAEMADDRRWPRWGPAAVEVGLASMLPVRLSTTGHTIGALNLYSYRRRDYDTDDVLAARIVAARVSAALAHARREQSLWQAIDARNHIGQAQGILMERHGLSADQAFAVLRRYSQQRNRRLRLIADDLITTRHLPRSPRP